MIRVGRISVLFVVVVACGLSVERAAPAQIIGVKPPISKLCAGPPVVARYTFDDVLTDMTGGNGAFVAGAVAPTFVAGRFGKALHFANGASASTTIKALPTQWSTTQWVRQTNATIGDQISTAGGCALFTGRDIISQARGVNLVYAASVGGGNTNCTGTGAVYRTFMRANEVEVIHTVGTWTHFATTFDGTTGRVYKDGVELGATTRKFDAATAQIWALGEPLGPAGTSQNTFVGDVDELRVYGARLSTQEISNIYRTNDVTSSIDGCGLAKIAPAPIAPRPVVRGL